MHLPASCFLLGCLLITGCESWHRRGGTSKEQIGREPFQGPPTAEKLVGFLNRHADQLAVIESTDVSLVAHVQGKRMPGLVGFMVCEKPRSFRLTGDALSTQYVDIGSNNDQFWFWVKDEGSPLYYCSYSDYEKGVKLPLPFQPEWVVQALGMAKYDPSKQYQIETTKGTYELIENTTVQGLPVKKITVFTRETLKDQTRPQVIGHVIQDSRTGNTICRATVRRQRTATYKTPEGETSIAYPSDVLLEWPAEKLSMELKVGKATVNKRVTNEEASRYFTLPNWPGIRAVDLARLAPGGSPTGREVRQASGLR